jgi:hypothetical protein
MPDATCPTCGEAGFPTWSRARQHWKCLVCSGVWKGWAPEFAAMLRWSAEAVVRSIPKDAPSDTATDPKLARDRNRH